MNDETPPKTEAEKDAARRELKKRYPNPRTQGLALFEWLVERRHTRKR